MTIHSDDALMLRGLLQARLLDWVTPCWLVTYVTLQSTSFLKLILLLQVFTAAPAHNLFTIK